MAKLIAGKINLSEVDKSQLFKGSKGIYLDILIRLNDEPDQYGNHGMITQGIAKEARQAGVKGAILGNVKTLNISETKHPQTMTRDDLDGLPF